MTFSKFLLELYENIDNGIIKKEGDRYVFVEPDEIVRNRNE